MVHWNLSLCHNHSSVSLEIFQIFYPLDIKNMQKYWILIFFINQQFSFIVFHMIIKLPFCDSLSFVNINPNSWGYLWEKYSVFYIIFIDTCITINFLIKRCRTIKSKPLEPHFHIHTTITSVTKCETGIRRGLPHLFIAPESGVNELK